MAERTSVLSSLEEAASLVKNGDVLGIGGFVTTNKPMAVLRQLMKERRRNLSILAFPSSLEIDMMIALDMVKQVTIPYVGAEAFAPVAPVYAKRASEGHLDIREVDLSTVLFMLRAKMQGLPFMPTRSVIGTSLPELNPIYRKIEDPFGGPPLYAVPPAEVDVAIIHAAQADEYGNVQHLGAPFADAMFAHVAKKVIVQVERVVGNEEIRRQPLATTIPAGTVSAVVLAPYGAHPFASQNYYQVDGQHLKEYLEAAKAFVEGDVRGFEEYVSRYIDGPGSLPQYLQTVGFERIISLQ